MSTLASHIHSIDQRRAERSDVFYPTQMRRKSPPFGDSVAANLVNISRLGFMARVMLDAMDGKLVSIDLPGIGELKARQVWSMENTIGGEFLNPIDPAVYEGLLEILAESSEPRSD
ncbi:PilZ domain-containing protein [Sphingobium boeckii]|uniref:PilZ domain-containing protein n=1 Tax=Sphingobium boeckii TaxID=1082345 RepID=A0A7W9EGZ6_9SPHN|nr:PilZ domain-containing protein [Sphingobium boeckii]MBB5687231.1 hypothetical protein [Sphingobium boeckii]